MSLPTPYYDDGQITLYCGDCREILLELESVDLILTDPPYGIGWNTDYSKLREVLNSPQEALL